MVRKRYGQYLLLSCYNSSPAISVKSHCNYFHICFLKMHLQTKISVIGVGERVCQMCAQVTIINHLLTYSLTYSLIHTNHRDGQSALINRSKKRGPMLTIEWAAKNRTLMDSTADVLNLFGLTVELYYLFMFQHCSDCPGEWPSDPGWCFHATWHPSERRYHQRTNYMEREWWFVRLQVVYTY